LRSLKILGRSKRGHARCFPVDVSMGKQADLCVWRIESLAELGYWIGLPGPELRIFGGRDA
jgi:hypothetical protein